MPVPIEPITEEERNRLVNGDTAFDHLRVRNYKFWRLYLHPDQTYLYRCYVWLTADHRDFQQRPELDFAHARELETIVRSVHAALAIRSKPAMVNEFFAGNEYISHRGHAHLHLVPRYHEPAIFRFEEFPDERFGQNPWPYTPRKVAPEMIESIRFSLSSAMRAVACG